MTYELFMEQHGALITGVVQAAARRSRHHAEDIRQAAALGVVAGLGLPHWTLWLAPSTELQAVSQVVNAARTEVNRLMRPTLRAERPLSTLGEQGDEGEAFAVEDAGQGADEQLTALRLERDLGLMVLTLPARQRVVAEGRFLADPPVTLAALALRLGISLWSARHAENLARRRLLQLARANNLID